jgi:hypothetical protein
MEYKTKDGYLINVAWQKELDEIIKSYKDGSKEPLDEKDIEFLVNELRNHIKLFEKVITIDEYLQLINPF